MRRRSGSSLGLREALDVIGRIAVGRGCARRAGRRHARSRRTQAKTANAAPLDVTSRSPPAFTPKAPSGDLRTVDMAMHFRCCKITPASARRRVRPPRRFVPAAEPGCVDDRRRRASRLRRARHASRGCWRTLPSRKTTRPSTITHFASLPWPAQDEGRERAVEDTDVRSLRVSKTATSARLPGSSEPISSAMPQRFRPALIVAISSVSSTGMRVGSRVTHVLHQRRRPSSARSCRRNNRPSARRCRAIQAAPGAGAFEKGAMPPPRMLSLDGV